MNEHLDQKARALLRQRGQAFSADGYKAALTEAASTIKLTPETFLSEHPEKAEDPVAWRQAQAGGTWEVESVELSERAAALLKKSGKAGYQALVQATVNAAAQMAHTEPAGLQVERENQHLLRDIPRDLDGRPLAMTFAEVKRQIAFASRRESQSISGPPARAVASTPARVGSQPPALEPPSKAELVSRRFMAEAIAQADAVTAKPPKRPTDQQLRQARLLGQDAARRGLNLSETQLVHVIRSAEGAA